MNLLILLFYLIPFNQEDASSGSLIAFVIGLAIFIGIILIMRSIGAWMFRINEVVEQLEKINYQLNKLLKQNNKDS
tara:strand:+ start:50 stop:277 length:228 start_codon:yes stop_codon:yes gene_type:complete